MKCFFFCAALVWFALEAIPGAHAQRLAPIVVVPADEMSRDPSLRQTPVAPQPTPHLQPEARDYASVPPQSAPGRPVLPAKLSYNSCTVEGPYIAMTFDDGPNPQLTPKLLDMLKERGLKATFFVVGKNVEEFPEIVRRMSEEGHEVANHSWSHVALTKIGGESFRKQIENTNDSIARVTGKRPILMRPPYGATSALLNRRLTEQFGMKVILWSVDPLDWKYRNANRVYNHIVQNTHPGSIILTHDIHATTVAAMPATFDSLLAKGYKFVTVSELIAMEVGPQLVKKEASLPPVPAAP
ncbi:MAG TPA: polysaccharide deacetylase family protein [Terrimicrobiaceae bacterium]